MGDLKTGDRVSHKRRGCRREYGTIVAGPWLGADGQDWWVRVQWDHGPVCLWEPEKLKVERQKVR